MNNKNVPFYPNNEDGVRCQPACIHSVLAALLPERSWSKPEIDELVGFKEGLMTWPMKAYVELHALGLNVVVYDSMSFERFIADPRGYLLQEVGEELTDIFYNESDVLGAVEDSKTLLKSGIQIESGLPTYSTLTELIGQGYLCICHIDQAKLLGDEHAEPDEHAVLVLEANDQGVVIHNPGPPPRPAQPVTRELFDEVWGYNADAARTLFAIRR